MFWDKFPVTVKRLHRNPVKEAYIDLLIAENDFMLYVLLLLLLYLLYVIMLLLYVTVIYSVKYFFKHLFILDYLLICHVND